MWKWNVEPASAIEIDGWMDGGGDKMRRWYIMCTHLSYYISYEKIPDVNTLIYQRHFTVAKPTIKASCLKWKIPKRSHIRSTEMKMLSNSRSPSYWAWTLSLFFFLRLHFHIRIRLAYAKSQHCYLQWKGAIHSATEKHVYLHVRRWPHALLPSAIRI